MHKKGFMSRQLTRNDVAIAAGVAPSTVSRALTGSPLLPQATIDHVRKIADEIGYKPNRLASQLASNKSFTIGFVVPELQKRRGPFQVGYFADLLDATVREGEKSDFRICIHTISYNDLASASKLNQLYQSKSFDGLIINGISLQNNLLSQLLELKIPFITVGYFHESLAFPMINCRSLLAFQAMFKVLEYKGYQEIIFVSGDMQFYDGVSQKKDFFQALQGSNIKLSQELVGDFSRKSGYQAAEQILKMERKKKTAVFLANDLMATGFYRYAYEHQIAIPKTIGVIGSDDEVISRTLFPELATIRQPREEMGNLAVNELLLLIKEKSNQSKTELPCEFIERNSI